VFCAVHLHGVTATPVRPAPRRRAAGSLWSAGCALCPADDRTQRAASVQVQLQHGRKNEWVSSDVHQPSAPSGGARLLMLARLEPYTSTAAWAQGELQHAALPVELAALAVRCCGCASTGCGAASLDTSAGCRRRRQPPPPARRAR
jgi:hypothetical protein